MVVVNSDTSLFSARVEEGKRVDDTSRTAGGETK